MKVVLISIASLALVARGAPVPKADPEAFFNLGAVAIPAITSSAMIDGLLLGKVAFLKAAILANLLLAGSGGSDESDSYGPPIEDSYGPPVDSYGAPAVSYEEPAPSYGAPTYDEPSYSPPTYDAPAPPISYAPAPVTYEEPADAYGAPVADPLPSYGAPHGYYRF